MSALKTAVLRQIAYAKSVRSVIRSIMRRMLDGEWINRIFASSDDEFNRRLDEALKSLDIATATSATSAARWSMSFVMTSPTYALR